MSKNKNNAKIEIFLVSLISLCMILLIHISEYKLNEIILNSNSIIVEEQTDKQANDLLAKEIVKNKLDACTMMEIYDKNFNIVMRVSASSVNNNNRTFSNLKNYKSLIDLFNKYPQGHTKIQLEDCEEDVYFKWTENTDSEQRLILVYITKPITENLWMIPFLCYLTLILIFILIIRLHISRQDDRIEYYHRISMKVQDKIFK